MGGHPPLPAGSSRPPLCMRSPSHPLAGSGYPHHQRPLHPYTGPTPTPYTPRHFSQRQYEQHLLPKQGSILPHLQDGLHTQNGSKYKGFHHPSFSIYNHSWSTNGAFTTHTSSNNPGLRLACFANSKNIWANTHYSTMPTMSSNNFDCFALANISLAP